MRQVWYKRCLHTLELHKSFLFVTLCLELFSICHRAIQNRMLLDPLSSPHGDIWMFPCLFSHSFFVLDIDISRSSLAIQCHFELHRQMRLVAVGVVTVLNV